MAKRKFTGVFIPAKIWLNKYLTVTEKFLLAEIDALSEDGEPCYANNRHFGDALGCKPTSISNHLMRLQTAGFLTITYKDEKTKAGRLLSVNSKRYHPTQEMKPPTQTVYDPTQEMEGGTQEMKPPTQNVEQKDNLNTNEKQNKEKGANALSSENESLKEKKEKEKKPSPGARPKKAILKVDLSEKYQNFNDPAAIAQLWERWLKYRSDTGHAFKSEDSIITCFGKLQTYSKGDAKTAKEIVEASIGNGWQGLFEIKLPAAKAQSFQPQQKSGINRFGGDMDKYKEKPLF